MKKENNIKRIVAEEMKKMCVGVIKETMHSACLYFCAQPKEPEKIDMDRL